MIPIAYNLTRVYSRASRLQRVETRRPVAADVGGGPVSPLAIPAIGGLSWVCRSMIPQRLTDVHGTLGGKWVRNGR